MTLNCKGVKVSHHTGLSWAWGEKGWSFNKIWIPPSCDDEEERYEGSKQLSSRAGEDRGLKQFLSWISAGACVCKGQ